VKEGLHNRHMVGLTTWQTFFARTAPDLARKKGAVDRLWLVGQGWRSPLAAFGGTVMVMRLTRRALCKLPLTAGGVIARGGFATGRCGRHRDRCSPGDFSRKFSISKDGVFLLNAGHRADEIDLVGLECLSTSVALPYVEEYILDGKSVFPLCRRAMANLTAGAGDSLKRL